MIHLLVTGSQLPGYWRFRKALGQPEATQLEVLKNILASLSSTGTGARFALGEKMSYRQFASAVPVTDYSFWEQDILRQKHSGSAQVCVNTERYQPTSGSTSAQKWIPYSKSFMREMDGAIQPWLGDVGINHPRAFKGCQYWSLSWLPQEQRDSRPSNDDLELLPTWKRIMLERVMAVPSAVTYTKTMEESQFATLAHLCARRDLSLVSVWSPTFWLTLLDKLILWRESLAETLDSGRWSLPGFSSDLKCPHSGRGAKILREFQGTELIEHLWPMLSLISCWDSAGSKMWAQQVRRRHPSVFLQGKGLWATEGVMTIPFQGQYPAAITSHFLEWMDLDNDRVYPTWELKPGQMVQPLLSGGHGLLRYKLNDAVLVKGTLGATPTFEFQGRLRETDLVGEKLSAQLTEQAFQYVEEQTGVRPLTMYAVRTQLTSPYYLVLVRSSDVQPDKIQNVVEEALSRVFHYKLARELGQLGPVRVRMDQQPERVYQQVLVNKGLLAGDIKFEALSEIAEEFLP
ncbi:MAG: GH3 auxin-responsive promoter family protein [Bdellovibrionales bacterium]|nr:GH3 auxin-responsive promoter family protein [Bdellovibrionales bacterium]